MNNLPNTRRKCKNVHSFLAFLLFVCLAITPYQVQAQEKVNVTLNVKNELVENVFSQLSNQTGFKFFYDQDVVNTTSRISIKVKNSTLQDVLDKITAQTNLYFNRNNNTISVGRQKEKDNVKSGKRKTVSGTVVDQTGESVIGVNVLVKGTANGMITDINGNYSLSDVSEDAIISFSFVGYQTAEVRANSKDLAKITLKEDSELLDEVIVVGYGVQRRSDVTGAISSVSSEKLNATPSSSLGEMLRGQAAGVQVTTSNAAPGGSSSILIRGRRSLSGGNDPLYIVDGVPMSSIDDLNSNDIASLEVLKDASSQSIYGARAANGVILITTKRGQSGKIKISYNTYFASQSIHRNFEFYDGEEWAALRKEAYYNANLNYDEADCFRGLMLDALKSGESVDWENLMIKSAWQQKHDILIQSGGDKTKYALGIGYFNQDGMVPNSSFQRLNGRLNIDHKLFKNLTIGTNFSYTKSWRKTADGSFNSFITMPPLAKVYNDDGSLREDVTEAGESHYNPLWNLDYSDNRSQTDRLLINFFADWKITKELSYRANGSLNNRTVHSSTYQGIKHTTGRNNGGKATAGTSFSNDYLFENIFNYVKDFNKNHHLDATFMQSVNVIDWKNMGLNGTGFANDDLTSNAIGSANEYGTPTWELSDRKLLSFLGRIRYNLFEKYLFTFALRVDGSSVFGKNNKYGYFPSGAFAWRINEESFLKNEKWLSNLKLRLSYGAVGNQGVTPYKSLGLTDRYLTEFGSNTAIGYLPGNELTNPNLKWETSTSANIGLDFGFFNGRISGTIEYYNTKTSDLLVTKSIPNTLGYLSQTVNLAEMKNSGIEITLNTTPIKIKDFSWDVNFTFTKNKNEIKKIDGQVDEKGKPLDDINNKWFVGHPMNVYYDYIFDGIWQKNDDIANSHMPTATPGSIKLRDVNNDNQITADDRVVMQRDPKWIGTIGTVLRYKAFDLSAEMYMAHGGTIYNPYLTTFENGGDLTAKRNGIRRNYWTLNNPSNEAPAPNMTQAPAYIASLGYQDASYIRLRNVTLGYNVPHSFISKAYIQSLRLYMTLSNFWTKTDVQAYGPEQTPGDYPEPKTILFGLNVTF